MSRVCTTYFVKEHFHFYFAFSQFIIDIKVFKVAPVCFEAIKTDIEIDRINWRLPMK